ncbi:hypothetical protein [Burkholderia sp. Z1]|uniref:hypothetical protein n=1 Tax=Burkholderia sp. Z1 TaxID=2759039 RepID=UPI0018691574|nr:hypothetical protein [Burkholderia sp. Z1]
MIQTPWIEIVHVQWACICCLFDRFLCAPILSEHHPAGKPWHSNFRNWPRLHRPVTISLNRFALQQYAPLFHNGCARNRSAPRIAQGRFAMPHPDTVAISRA